MEHVKKIIVSIQFSKSEIELGELVSEGRDIYFKYYTDFITKGIEISPIKLKLNAAINKADAVPFGLFFYPSCSNHFGQNDQSHHSLFDPDCGCVSTKRSHECSSNSKETCWIDDRDSVCDSFSACNLVIEGRLACNALSDCRTIWSFSIYD